VKEFAGKCGVILDRRAESEVRCSEGEEESVTWSTTCQSSTAENCPSRSRPGCRCNCC